ncbi:MAG TPA: hypothetical protein VMS00_09625 [Acidimicrobiales bacterium]|nr:hypothetical protein [Acidimicrobiales bacterium]
MSTVDGQNGDTVGTSGRDPVDLKLEVVVIPVNHRCPTRICPWPLPDRVQHRCRA